MRVWGKLLKKNKIIASFTGECHMDTLSEKEALDICMDEICRHFDIQKPLWFPLHQKDLSQYYIVRFYQDAFMEEVSFDLFEIEVIAE